MNKRLAIGIDIGGTRTKMGLVDLVNGNVIQTLIYPTETKDERRFYNQIKEAVEQFSTTAIDSRNTISGIGMGIPGFVFANGVIDSTYGFIDFMEDYPMKELIEDNLST
jgi:glucokinase